MTDTGSMFQSFVVQRPAEEEIVHSSNEQQQEHTAPVCDNFEHQNKQTLSNQATPLLLPSFSQLMYSLKQ